MRWIVLAAILLGSACGGDATPGGQTGTTPGPSTVVDGDWILYLGQCVEALNFSAGQYGVAFICPDTNNSVLFDLQAEKGTYALSGGNIYFTALQSTCPAATVVKSYYAPYSVSATNLSLTYSDGISVFQRNTAAGGSAAATFGCFSNGVFTPGPLVAL